MKTNLKKTRISLSSFLSFIFILIHIIPNQAYSENPYSLNFSKEAIILSSGTAITGISFLIETRFKSLTEDEIKALNTDKIPSFDKSATNNWNENISKISDFGLAINIGAPVFLFLSDKIRDDAATIGVLYLETMISAGSITTITKDLFQRVRPYAYNPNVPLDKKLNVDSKLSFFSGHTSMSFASAAFLSKVYFDYYPNSGSKWLVLTASMLSASAVGAMRYESGMHFPTDIITGALIGTAVGWLIPELHKNKEKFELTMYPARNSQIINFTINF